VYEDAVEMQTLFLKARDDICKNGEMLLTPALSYTERHLQAALDTEKKEKIIQEQKDDEEKKKGGGGSSNVEEKMDEAAKPVSVTLFFFHSSFLFYVHYHL
jgi:protein polybromo-1